ncbi:nSTAND1 domain-containing NTPase [Leptothoe kymatousa]|uniref:Pentapeptide repeat-containing protein n=1 Tax=Leptothoe kymatousa TAU-MAC 1615 TaxID=2364775 RepID=A0ABS5Y4H8_9CYAN|nr:pentapeptide repeat-containing protein [Leptothoe kymatousa]MBT9312732.1 pentapeptide repeat-containing protein [Leptothoe kymatousa TAU-MAC 1615]
MSRDALIVGINSYQYLNPLTAPAKDGEAIAQRLGQTGEFKIWRIPEHLDRTQGNRPTVSSKQPVSQQQLKQALKRLFLPESNQAPETALFYFSGHGIRDDEGFDQGYLATSDTDPKHPSTGISLRWLQWLLSESQVKQQIIWLDCCHSGSLIVNVGAANPGNSDSRDRCFIASSRDFETSWEDLNSEYSVLTKALLDGLEPSRLPGRWINNLDLVAYVNQALQGELQTPVCTNFGEAIKLTRPWQAEAKEKLKKPVDNGICPYKGLEFFDCNGEDPKYFFGREKLIGQLLDQVRTGNFMALVGASGNGKSSVLRAGLIHRLSQGRRIAGSDRWQILITRPDVHPMQNLAAAFVPEGGSQLDRAEALGRAAGLLKEGAAGLQRLVQASRAERIILVIDQFEEVFTRCNNAEEREQFFNCLMGALQETGEKLCLIIAMRADFVGKCLEQDYGGLAQRVQDHMVSVLPLNSEELKEAICKPAEQANLMVEAALVTEILDDIQGAPGSLPLLQYTLKELWQRRQGSTLMLATYQELGGINGTLDQRATEIYDSCDGDQQRTVRHIFQQLTQLGEGTEDTRRRVFLDNLVSEPLHPAARVRAVIETLSSQENRLLVTSEVIGKGENKERRAIVDVAHEALIRHWRLLRRWIEDNRDLLRQQRRIEASAVSWQGQNRAKGYLLQGFLLKEALRFQKQQSEILPLSDVACSFLRKSVRQRNLGWLKIASLLLLLPPIVDYSLHQWKIDQLYSKLNGAERNDPRGSVNSLTKDCGKRRGALTSYLIERATGEYCRSLANERFTPEANLDSVNLYRANLSFATLDRANLSFATLDRANLSFATLDSANLYSATLDRANLYSANLDRATLDSANLYRATLDSATLDSANLYSANLYSANLYSANLYSANLYRANLDSANLYRANLYSAIFLATDLRTTQKLTTNQLEGKNPPLLCNSPLPADIKIDQDRDCDQLADILHQRYPARFNSLEAAEEYINEKRQITWE